MPAWLTKRDTHRSPPPLPIISIRWPWFCGRTGPSSPIAKAIGCATSSRDPARPDHHIVIPVRPSQTPPLLADAADVLSDQLEVQLERLARLLKPHAADLDRCFRARLRQRRFDARQIKALCDITPG